MTSARRHGVSPLERQTRKWLRSGSIVRIYTSINQTYSVNNLSKTMKGLLFRACFTAQRDIKSLSANDIYCFCEDGFVPRKDVHSPRAPLQTPTDGGGHPSSAGTVNNQLSGLGSAGVKCLATVPIGGCAPGSHGKMAGINPA